MEAGRFPSARAVSQAEDPVRAYEEERRLGYVAWTRARRSLTLLYDPAVPSPFLLEAFSPAELGLSPGARLSSRIRRSIESRNGSVSSAGSTSRIESLTP